MNKDSNIRYYDNREGTSVWGVLVFAFAATLGGISIGFHSLLVTGGVLLVSFVVWWLGRSALSKSCYFVSSSKAGFKDFFRSRAIDFEEVKSVAKTAGGKTSHLIFECLTGTVEMPLDLIDESWLLDVQNELAKRGITISTRVFGVDQQEE